MVFSGQPECTSLSPDLPSPPEVDVSLLSTLETSHPLRFARSSRSPPGSSRMVTSLESSEKDRICIASRLWQLYCQTPAEQTERLRLSSFLAYEAEEKDYDAPERRQVSSALTDEAEKEEAGCSGASA